MHSPSILLRSGIEPEGEVASLPVGDSLQDHPLALFWLALRPEAWPDIHDRQTNCIVRYSSGLDGGVENDMAFISQNQTQSANHAVTAALAASSGSTPTGTWGIGTGGGGRGRGLLCVQLNHQLSRGSLWLASRDPDAPPVINSNLLDERSDRVRLGDGIHRAFDLLVQPAFMLRSRTSASIRQVEGVVDDVGVGVANVRPGDRVVLSAVPTCGTCYFCARGEPYSCGRMAQLRRPNFTDDETTVGSAAGLGTFSEAVAWVAAGATRQRGSRSRRTQPIRPGRS